MPGEALYTRQRKRVRKSVGQTDRQAESHTDRQTSRQPHTCSNFDWFFKSSMQQAFLERWISFSFITVLTTSHYCAHNSPLLCSQQPITDWTSLERNQPTFTHRQATASPLLIERCHNQWFSVSVRRVWYQNVSQDRIFFWNRHPYPEYNNFTAFFVAQFHKTKVTSWQ